jgi:hypothetical protein
LSIVLLVLFAAFLVGHAMSGYRADNEEKREHGEPVGTLPEYLTGGEFAESVFENWESEFLQMGMYVLLTTWLFQRGSAESKDPDRRSEQDADPRKHRDDPDAPWPVRRGGVVLAVYEYSLAIAFGLLFALAFALHAMGGARAFSHERLEHGEGPIGALAYLGTSRFWFESFQNWQSEFLAVWSIVLLSIVLRQRGSPQSKPVHAPHSQTGG